MKIPSFIAWSVVCGWLACGAEVCRGGELGGALRDFVVRTWTKAEGLPDDSVTTLLQTRDGYLWIGTGTGLVRFDGVKFTEVPLFAAGRKSRVSITALCEDAVGGLWVGSQEQGLFCRLHGSVKQYRKAEGLLDDGVTSLTTDSEGRVWIGTHHGLNRWGGKAFAAFTPRDGLPNELVTSVHAARSGTVWITTHGGMCQWVQGRITPYHFPSAEGAQTVAIAEASRPAPYHSPSPEPERDPEFLDAYEDGRGNLWAFCATYLVNLAKGKQKINYFPGEKSASMRIWSLCEDRDGRLWIGASGRGVFYFDGADFQPVMLNEGRWPNDVRAICEDHEGNLWLGISGGGLTQLSPQSFAVLKGSQGLPSGAATCLMLDAGGRLCVGMESGGVYASLGKRFEKLAEGTMLGQDLAASLCAGPDGSLWVGTVGTGLYRIKGDRAAACTTDNGLSDDCVLAVCSDREGNVWAGTQSGALHRFVGNALTRFGRSDGLPGTPITTLLPARDGGLWIGTGNDVLLRCDQQLQHIARVRLSPKLSGKQILGLYEGTNRTLWVGTAGGGLGCVAANGSWAWDTEDGLPDDMISGVVEDADGNLWLATGKGLCRVARASLAQASVRGGRLKARLLFETEAGPTGAPNVGWPRALRAPEGGLWFATTSGLIGIDPHGWEAEKPAPQVHLEAVLVDNQPLNLLPTEQAGAAQPTRPLSLPANLQALELQFTALSFEAPEKIRFRHKLERFDADLIETGSERRVKYGRLPSGEYQFHVTACNAEGVWNETGDSLAFVIPTPLWRAPWVLGLYGLSAAGAVAGTVRLVSHRRLRRRLARLEQQQAMERERVRIAQDMHDEIGSKLTKISFLSERAKGELKEPGPLADKIDSIAGTSRELLQALDVIVWAVNPRNDTLEELGAYLSQYARDYFQDTPVECDVSLQGELPHLAMSAEVRHNLFLAFEECLNNVLKHSGASQVRIEFRVEKGRLNISASDNGQGFENPPERAQTAGTRAEGNGLVNMHQRLRDVGGECTIKSRAGEGTTVSLSLTLNSWKLAAQ